MIAWMMTKTALALVTGLGATVHPAWVLGTPAVYSVTSIQQARTEAAGRQWVIADIESWRMTPRWQARHPARTIRRICQIAHRHGARCMAAPGRDLGAGYRWSLAAAPWADAWEIQSQTLELDPAAYAAFVHAVAHQLRAEHPGITVLAGLTTSSRVGHVTGWRLLRALHATRHMVRGYWLNVPQAGPWCPTCGPLNPRPAAWLLKRVRQQT